MSNVIEGIIKEHPEVVDGKPKNMPSENKSIEYFAKFEVESNEEISGDIVLNANGAPSWKFTQFNYITKFINNLKYKTVEELFEFYPNLDPNKNPAIVQSIWFNEIFTFKKGTYEKSGKIPDYIKVGGLNSAIVDKGDSTINLTANDKIIYDFLTYLKQRTEEMTRFGDKANTAAIDFETYITETKPDNWRDLSRLIIQNIIGEVIEIKHLDSVSKDVDFMHLNNKQSMDKLVTFGWLPQSIKDRLMITDFSIIKGREIRYLDKLNEGPQKKLYEDLEVEVIKHIESKGKEIESRLKEITKSIEGFDINSITKSIHDISLLSKWYYASSYLNRMESFNMLFGSLRNYASGTEVFKRLSMYSATGSFPNIGSWFLGWINSQENYGRDIEKLYTDKDRQWTDKFNAIHFAKEPVSSPTAKPKYYNDIEEKIPVKDREALNALLKDYQKGEYADASGAVTLDFYKFLNNSIGTWNPPQQEAYEAQLEFERSISKLEKGEITALEFEAIRARADQTVGELLSIFNPKKWQYAGSIYTQDGVASKMDVRAFEKFAIAPLIPSMVYGTPMANIVKSMYRSQIDMYNFASGSKLAWDNKNYDFVKESEQKEGSSFKPTVLSLNNFKEQVPSENEYKDEGIFSSQMRILVTQGLFEGGEFVGSPKARVAYHQYKDAIARYTNALKKEIDVRIGTTEDLVNFIKEEFDKRDIPDYVQDFLQVLEGKLKYPLDQSLHLFYTQNIITSIVNNRLIRQKLPGGQFIQVPNLGYKNSDERADAEYGRDDLNFYHIDPDTGEVQPCEIKIAFSDKWKPLLKLKHYDGDIIGTVERLNDCLLDKGFVEEHQKKFTLVGCRIPVQALNTIEVMRIKQFLPVTAGQIVIVPAEITVKAGADFDFDKLNIYEPQLDKDGNLHKEEANFNEAYDKAISKIHTAKESIEKQKDIIKETLDALTPEQEQLIPEIREIRQQLYDIYNGKEVESDEEYTLDDLKAAFSLEGSNKVVEVKEDRITYLLERLKENDDINESLNIIRDVKNEIRELKRGIAENSGYMKSMKKGIINSLVESISTLVLTPDNYLSLITPNDISILENVYEERGIPKDSFNKEQVLYPLTSLRIFDDYTVSKSSLGIAAKTNVFFAIAQEAGLKIAKPSASIFGKETSLSSRFTNPSKVKYKEGNDPVEISKFIAQFISGHVDVAKDARIARIRADEMLTPIYLWGVMRRIHPNDMVEFLMDPKLQEFIKDLQNLDSITLQHLLTQKLGKKDAKKMVNKTNFKRVYLEDMMLKEGFPIVDDAKTETILGAIIESSAASNDLKNIAEFLTMQRDSGKVTSLSIATSYDTSNYKSFIEFAYPDYSFNKIIEDGYWDEESLIKMRDESVKSPLRISDYVRDNFSEYYTIVSNPEFIKQALYTYQETAGVSIDKFSRDFTNDFLTFLLQNLTTNQGVDLYEQFIVTEKLLDRNNPNNIEQKIVKLIEKLGKDAHYVTDNEFFKSIYFEKSTDASDVTIFPRLKNPNVDSHSKEIINEALMNLINPVFNTPLNPEIRATFKLLTNLAFLQNGTNQPLGSLISVLPTDTYTAMFSSMLAREDILFEIGYPASKLWRNFDTMFKTRRNIYFPRYTTNYKPERYDRHNYYVARTQPIIDINSVPLPKEYKVLGNIKLNIIEDWVQKGLATTTIRTNSYHIKFYEGDGVYETDRGNKVNISYKGKVKIEDDKIKGTNFEYTKDEFAAAEGFGTWENFTQQAAYAGKNLMDGESVHLYTISPIEFKEPINPEEGSTEMNTKPC